MTGSIYLILNTVNCKFYLGSAKDPAKRVHSHYLSLKRGDHHCVLLQRSWNKYGETAFMAFIHSSGHENAIEVEQRYLDFYFLNHRSKLLNVSPCAKGGYIVGQLPNAAEIHQSISEKMKGKPSLFKGIDFDGRYGPERAAEIIQKIKDNLGDRTGENNSFFGRTHTDEFKQQLSERRKGVEPANKGTDGPGRRCLIDGVEYKSVSQASRMIGMTGRKIITRLNSQNFPNFEYLDSPITKRN